MKRCTWVAIALVLAGIASGAWAAVINLLWYTYADPASRPPDVLSKGEPTTTVSPETDTDEPSQ